MTWITWVIWKNYNRVTNKKKVIDNGFSIIALETVASTNFICLYVCVPLFMVYILCYVYGPDFDKNLVEMLELRSDWLLSKFHNNQ